MPNGHASGESVVGVTIAFTILATIGCFMRLYTRFIITGSPGLDDGFTALATIFSIVLTASMCLQVKYGMGKHEANVAPEYAEPSLFWFWLSVWIYNLGLSSAKFSILVQLLRIFPQNVFRRATYFMIVIVSVFTCWTVFSAVFACVPVESFWKLDKNGKCLSRLAVWFTNAGLTIATDIAVVLLPLPMLRSLQLPKRQKIALMAVFALGGVTCVVSILRLSSLYAISVSTDVSWDNPLAAIWSSLEVNVAILCSCLPTLKACVTRVFPRFFSSIRATSYGRSALSRDKSRNRPDEQQVSGSVGLTYLNRKANGEQVYEGGQKSWDDGEYTRVGPGSPAEKPTDNNGIHVVTVVEQRQESPGPSSENSDSESQRTLVREVV